MVVSYQLFSSLHTPPPNFKVVDNPHIQVLHVPKSDVEIAKGMKSREKTVMVHNLAKNRSPEEHIKSIRNALVESIEH